jgi:hypothetical protein
MALPPEGAVMGFCAQIPMVAANKAAVIVALFIFFDCINLWFLMLN